MVLTDNQQIGVGLISLGLVFVALGVVLFLDAALMAIGTCPPLHSLLAPFLSAR